MLAYQAPRPATAHLCYESGQAGGDTRRLRLPAQLRLEPGVPLRLEGAEAALRIALQQALQESFALQRGASGSGFA